MFSILTQVELTVSLQEFLEGLSVCQAFFAETKAELDKMQSQAGASADKTETSRAGRHFRLMKKYAVDINANCKAFWSTVAEVILSFFLL
jgi:hypothetical protein